MGKVIKIIDLLNKIANGEEPPEKIRIAGHRYKYNKETKDYDSDIGMANENLFLNMNIFKELNTEIIVLDEEDEIDIQSIEEIDVVGCNIKVGDRIIPTENEINDYIIIKINKLVQAVKQLDNKLNKLDSNT